MAVLTSRLYRAVISSSRGCKINFLQARLPALHTEQDSFLPAEQRTAGISFSNKDSDI